VDDQEYVVCFEFPTEGGDSPEDYKTTLSVHMDCKAGSEWSDQDAPDSQAAAESESWTGPGEGEECSGVIADHPGDRDWWRINVDSDPSEWVSVCEQRGTPGVTFVLEDPDGDLHVGDRCVSDDNPQKGDYYVGILNVDRPSFYTWVWGAR
jgi:hypothetical protein